MCMYRMLSRSLSAGELQARSGGTGNGAATMQMPRCHTPLTLSPVQVPTASRRSLYTSAILLPSSRMAEAPNFRGCEGSPQLCKEHDSARRVTRPKLLLAPTHHPVPLRRGHVGSTPLSQWHLGRSRPSKSRRLASGQRGRERRRAAGRRRLEAEGAAQLSDRRRGRRLGGRRGGWRGGRGGRGGRGDGRGHGCRGRCGRHRRRGGSAASTHRVRG